MPENYYLDKKDNIYKKCYERCKTCSEKGNETINNCYECINGFTFLNDSFVELNNCYDICQYYYNNMKNQYSLLRILPLKFT